MVRCKVTHELNHEKMSSQQECNMIEAGLEEE